MPITVSIEDDLLARAQELTGISNPDVLIQMGLQALVDRAAARQLSLMGGSEPQLRSIPRRRPH